MPKQYTKRLAKFAYDLKYKDIPKDAINHLKLCILDTLGCGIFGSTTRGGMILADYIHSLDKNKESTIWGTKFRSASSNAALVNGTLVHGFELDDYHPLALVHPGGIAVTSALATAESKGKVNGKDFLTAVAVGYELTIRLGFCCAISLFKRGLHATGSCGTIGSAVAAGKILNLDKDGMLNAIGIAASFPSGLMAAQYGGMVKRLFAGKAAQNGVTAAQLASRGFNGAKDVLEAEFGGFCKALCDDYDLHRLTAGLGKQYGINSVAFKKYSCVGTNLAALDAVRKIVGEHSFDIQDIKKVTIKVNYFTKKHSGWEYKPQSIMTAQMNMYYCVAIMLIEGDCFVDQFLERKLCEPKVLELVKKIDVVVDSEINKLPITQRSASIVEVDLKMGERFSIRFDHPKGNANNPMRYEEIKEKFRKLAKRKMISAKIDHIMAAVEKLEELDDMRKFSHLLAA